MTQVMSSEDIQLIAFNIILYSGNARTQIHQAFTEMRTGDFSLADHSLVSANEAVLQAHKAQTDLLQSYASGTKIEMEIIMVHAQDHLMTTMTLQEVATEMNYLYQANQKILNQIEQKAKDVNEYDR